MALAFLTLFTKITVGLVFKDSSSSSKVFSRDSCLLTLNSKFGRLPTSLSWNRLLSLNVRKSSSLMSLETVAESRSNGALVPISVLRVGKASKAFRKESANKRMGEQCVCLQVRGD